MQSHISEMSNSAMILCPTADGHFSQCEGIVCVRYNPQMFILKPIMELDKKMLCGKKGSETSEYKTFVK